MKIDKAAANRFITAAINSGRKNLTHEDAGTHTRFEAEVDKLLESDEDEEEDEEEVVVVESLEKAAVKDDKKSRRPKMDPFAGEIKLSLLFRRVYQNLTCIQKKATTLQKQFHRKRKRIKMGNDNIRIQIR